MGVFSVIQKDRYHHSNIYSGAPMPYMQRITWSGVAMHAGVLPGYPATGLDDDSGPWQRAFPGARELGADTTAFAGEIAERGLRVPASWLAAGGWSRAYQ